MHIIRRYDNKNKGFSRRTLKRKITKLLLNSVPYDNITNPYYSTIRYYSKNKIKK